MGKENRDQRTFVTIIDEVLNAVTHGIAAIFAVFGFVLLLEKSVTMLDTIAYSIYSVSLILLFLISCLRHALFFSRASTVFRVLDHNSIFLLIAGTYTPYCLLVLKGWLSWVVLSIIWVCAGVGIVLTSVFLPRWHHIPKLATGLYVVMGWVILLAIWPLYQALSHAGFWQLVAGGVIYSLGAVIYHYKFPFAHLIWHFFVMGAALLMWLSIYSI